MAKRIIVTVIAVVLACFLIMKMYPVDYSINAKTNIDVSSLLFGSGNSQAQPQQPATPVVTPTTEPAKPADPGEQKPTENNNKEAEKKEPKKADGIPQTTEEIIDKYTDVMNKFKTSGAGYQKKEYQALPEEYRNFSSVVNVVLKFAEGYMTTEDNPNSLLSREKGAKEELKNEITIIGTDKGCLLKEFDPSLSSVKSAECVDLGDGTYKITFMLNDEANPEPTPTDTCVPVSAHGAVFGPASRADIMVEVEKVEKLAHAKCNSFDLTYTECYVECIYNPETDQLVDLYQHLNVDISADITLLVNIAGSARLTNDNHVYDIVW